MIKNKVFKIPLIIWVCISLISLGFGIWDMATGFEGNGFSFENILFTLLGAIIVGIIPFLIALIISYIYHKSK